MAIINKLKSLNGYFYRNLIAPRIYSFRDREILRKNRIISQVYQGKRCFIIGGGPSVSDIDLGLLNNEYTFTLNQFDKNPQYNKLGPKFHIISDSAYYTEGETEYFPKQFREKDKTIPHKTIMCLNLRAKNFVEKYGLFKNHRVYYFGTQGIFTGNLPFNIKLDKYVPQPKNSILLCLLIASWMGFKEIYLLGCEHNFLSFNIGYGKALTYSHNYEDELSKLDPTNDEVVKKYIAPRDLKLTYEKNVANVLQLFRNYRFFYQKARKTYPGIQIYNATPNSFLDIFPMIKFEDIKFDGK